MPEELINNLIEISKKIDILAEDIENLTFALEEMQREYQDISLELEEYDVIN